MLRERVVVPIVVIAALTVAPVIYVAIRDDEGGAMAEGRHLVHIVELDVEDRTMQVDEAVWVNDDREPNGFRIEDENDDVTTLDIASDVEVSIVGLSRDADADLDSSPLGELPGYLREAPDPDHRWASLFPFHIVVRSDGEIGLIEEQYVP